MSGFLTYLSIAYQFTIGLSNSQYQLWDQIEYPWGIQYSKDCIETDFDIKLKFWRFYAGGGAHITSRKADGKFFLEAGQYQPLFNDFPVSAGYSGKYFDVGYEYRCIHPVMAYLQDRDVRNKKDGAYQRIFVTFRHELSFK